MAGIKQFNLSMNGLRGFASLGVVVHHIWAGSVGDNFSPFSREIQFSGLFLQFGVELFFMISGFLITRSLIRHRSVKAFWQDRALRIYPAYIPLLLLLFILGPLAGYEYFDGVSGGEWLWQLILNLLFLPGVFPMEAALAVTWTLSFEAAFYLFAGIAWLLWRRWPGSPSLILVLVATAGLLFLFPTIVPFFAIGAGLSFIEPRLHQHSFVLGAAAPAALVLFFAAMLIYTGDAYGLMHLQGNDDPLTFASALLCAAILFASVVVQSGPFAALMRSRAFQWLGAISYSLYLWHTPIMFVTKRASISLFETDWPAFIFFAMTSMLIALPISWLSYALMERAFPAWMRSGTSVPGKVRSGFPSGIA